VPGWRVAEAGVGDEGGLVNSSTLSPHQNTTANVRIPAQLDQIRVQVFLIVKIKEESESDEAALDKILLSAALITAAVAAIGSDSSVIQQGDRAMGGWLLHVSTKERILFTRSPGNSSPAKSQIHHQVNEDKAPFIATAAAAAGEWMDHRRSSISSCQNVASIVWAEESYKSSGKGEILTQELNTG